MRRPLILSAVLLLTGAVGCAGSVATAASTASTASTTTTTTTTGTTATATATTTTTTTYYHVFPVVGCHVSYSHYHHDYPATDIMAARGCKVVAAIAGRVDEVSRHDRWDPSTNLGSQRGGLFVSIVGRDGVRYYGSHLEHVNRLIKPGVHVRAGQVIGRVGNSGDARGLATHLHFGLSWPTRHGIWWVRRGEVYPWPYLDAWRSGQHHKSPVAAVRRKRAQVGTVPPCRVDC